MRGWGGDPTSTYVFPSPRVSEREEVRAFLLLLLFFFLFFFFFFFFFFLLLKRTLFALDFVSRIRTGKDFAAKSMHHRTEVVGISSFDSRVIWNRRAIMAVSARFYIHVINKFSRGVEI